MCQSNVQRCPKFYDPACLLESLLDTSPQITNPLNRSQKPPPVNFHLMPNKTCFESWAFLGNWFWILNPFMMYLEGSCACYYNRFSAKQSTRILYFQVSTSSPWESQDLSFIEICRSAPYYVQKYHCSAESSRGQMMVEADRGTIYRVIFLTGPPQSCCCRKSCN